MQTYPEAFYVIFESKKGGASWQQCGPPLASMHRAIKDIREIYSCKMRGSQCPFEYRIITYAPTEVKEFIP